jgi:hypothetical protein
MIKNKTYNMILKNYKVYELDDEESIASIAEFENKEKTKSLTGLLIGDHTTNIKEIVDNFENGSEYTIRGNIINLDKDNYKEYDVILVDGNKTLAECLNNNEIFQVLSIKKHDTDTKSSNINEKFLLLSNRKYATAMYSNKFSYHLIVFKKKDVGTTPINRNIPLKTSYIKPPEDSPKIKSVHLFMYDNEDLKYKSYVIVVDIKNISCLRILDISENIEYLENGEFISYFQCKYFVLEVNVEKLSKEEKDFLLGNTTVYCVNIHLDNGKTLLYNMPWSTDDGIHNKLQDIYVIEDAIEITFDGRYMK